MATICPSLGQVAVVITALKILLIPAYKSTDFEVHRNWLALTHSLPLREWYLENKLTKRQNTSEWTLDYPPYFAYFEWLLSQVASFIDPRMLNVENLNYASWATVCFQRSSVILGDCVLIYALHRYVVSSAPSQQLASHVIALSLLLSPALLIIDHIHFQYNGMLYGILVLSLVYLRKPSTMLAGAGLFAALLCLKHIYLYLAPAFFVYILRQYCLKPGSIIRIQFLHCLSLALVLTLVICTAFGPFIYYGQFDQLLSRLFPFSRGLCHAYWAPNVWALYSLADRVLLSLAGPLKLSVNHAASASVTRGLVGDSSFSVLPSIEPRTTFLLTITFQALPLVKLFWAPSWESFIAAVTLCGYASFLFGWHVHEKAILLVMIPASLLALRDRRFLGAFRPLAIAGHVSLFPLIYTAHEFPIKVIYTITWLILFLYIFDQLAPVSRQTRIFLLDRGTFWYIAVAIPLILYCSLVHRLVFGAHYEFLPLMFISSYSALGICGSWLGFSVVYFT